MTPKEKEMLEAVIAYQRDVGKISKSVAIAARPARKDLMSDAERILETFRRKRGFATKAEAKPIFRRTSPSQSAECLSRRPRQPIQGRT